MTPMILTKETGRIVAAMALKIFASNADWQKMSMMWIKKNVGSTKVP